MPARVSRRLLPRRSFLIGAGATALLSCSEVACSRKSKRSSSDGTVVVGNHPLYIDEATNPGFEAATGMHVEYHEDITDDAAWLASVTARVRRSDSIDRDVVVVSDWVADRVADRLADHADDDRQVTWAQNMVGIAYDQRKVPTELTRIAQLFQPPLHGLVALPTDLRLALGMALLADHVDPSTVTADAAGATATRLANSVKLGQVLPFDGSRPIEHLVAGDALAAVVPASDTIGLEHERPDIRFVVPEEGGLLLTDVAVIPTHATNPDGARRYLDYVTDPVHAAARLRVVPTVLPAASPEGPNSIDAALRAAAPDVLADPRRNPTAEVRARLRSFRFLDDDEDRAFTALFGGVIHANR